LLIKLRNTHLNNNDLTGTIPSEIGLLIELENFSLYHNDLTGTIPTEVGLLIDDLGLVIEIVGTRVKKITSGSTISSEIGLGAVEDSFLPP